MMQDSKANQAEMPAENLTRRLQRLAERIVQRVSEELPDAIDGALEKAGLASRIQALSARLEALDTDPAEEAPREGKADAPRDKDAKRICSEPDCELPARARGLCSKHYQRLRYAEKRAQEADEPLPKSLAEARSRRGRKPARKTEKRGGSTCSKDDCQRPTYAKGMCGKHFMEWVRAQKELKTQQEQQSGQGSD